MVEAYLEAINNGMPEITRSGRPSQAQNPLRGSDFAPRLVVACGVERDGGSVRPTAIRLTDNRRLTDNHREVRRTGFAS